MYQKWMLFISSSYFDLHICMILSKAFMFVCRKFCQFFIYFWGGQFCSIFEGGNFVWVLRGPILFDFCFPMGKLGCHLHAVQSVVTDFTLSGRCAECKSVLHVLLSFGFGLFLHLYAGTMDLCHKCLWQHFSQPVCSGNGVNNRPFMSLAALSIPLFMVEFIYLVFIAC